MWSSGSSFGGEFRNSELGTQNAELGNIQLSISRATKKAALSVFFAGEN